MLAAMADIVPFGSLWSEEFRSPKGLYRLVITKEHVRIVNQSGGNMIDVMKKDDLDPADGWEFDRFDWSGDETMCVLHGRIGNHRKHHVFDVLKLDAGSQNCFKKINVTIQAQFEETLKKDQDRDKELRFGLWSVKLSLTRRFTAEFRALGDGGAKWNNDPDDDRYELELEDMGLTIELRKMYRVRRTLVQ